MWYYTALPTSRGVANTILCGRNRPAKLAQAFSGRAPPSIDEELPDEKGQEKMKKKKPDKKVRQTLRVATPIGTKDGEKEVHAAGTWGKPGDRYGLLLPSGFSSHLFLIEQR